MREDEEIFLLSLACAHARAQERRGKEETQNQLTKHFHSIFEYTRSHVKKVTNSPIKGLNHLLRIIMVNKGRIHGEIRESF